MKSFANSTLARIDKRLNVSDFFIAASILDPDQVDSSILRDVLIGKGLSAIQLLKDIEETFGFPATSQSRLETTITLPLPQLVSLSPTTSTPPSDLTEQMVSFSFVSLKTDSELNFSFNLRLR